MAGLFKNITSSCTDKPCVTCGSDEFECFVLDDNGYVIISDPKDDPSLVGRFFGEVRPASMRKMINEKIYQEVKIFDYQAICFINKDSANLASTLVAVSDELLPPHFKFNINLLHSPSNFSGAYLES
jgi:voltage-dependent calcium channel alpha-2/delta-3